MHTKVILLLLVSALLNGINAFSQGTPATRSFRVESGFGSNSGYSLLFDSRGYLWTSPDANGAVMFNGKEFTRFTDKDGLCGNQIMTIFEDKQGLLWFGSQGYGISTYDGGEFTTYTVSDSIGLTTDNISSFYQHSNGTMLIGGYRGGMMIFKDGRFSLISDSTRSKMTVWKMIEDEDGSIWFTTGSNGLGRLELGNTPADAKFTYYGKDAGVPTSMALGLIKDNLSGDLIIGSAVGLLRFRDGKVVKTYNETDGFYESVTKRFIRSLYQRANGDIYFGCFGRLWKLEEDSCFRVRRNGYIGSAPTDFAEDPNGNLWMTTEGNGLVQMFDNGIKMISNRQGDRDFFASTSHNNDIYAIAANSIYKVEDNRPVKLGKEFGADIFSANQMIVRDTNNILSFTNDHGVLLSSYDISDNSWRLSQADKTPQYQHERLNDRIVIMVGPSGIRDFNIYTYESNLLFEPKKGNIDYGLPYSITIDKDKAIWFGRYDIGSIVRLNGEDTLVLDDKDGMPKGAIYEMIADDNNAIWYLTMDGDYGYYKDGKVSNYTIPYEGSCRSMAFDNNRNLWVNHSKGIVFIELNGYEIIKYQLFNQSDGVQEVSPVVKGVFKMKNGNMVITKASESLFVIKPNEIKIPDEKPKVFLQHIKGKDNAELKSNWYSSLSGFYKTPKHLVLPYEHNHISFHLDMIYYYQPDSIKYSYKLSGYTNEWSKPQSSNVISITNLPPGDYVFECKAIGPNGAESDIIKYEFKVETPWFKTIWFYVGCVLIALIVVYLIVKWRLSKLRKDKERLEIVVQERTKEVVQQKEHLAEKNQEITDSINYAKRIQKAILPPDKLIKGSLPQSFILYKPKDIVAGDFYWLESFALATDSVGANNNGVLFAAADCTGHGVPGAMVSVVCNNALNRSVREHGLIDPAAILDKTREIVIAEFEKSEEDVKDGMDIALCSLTFAQTQSEEQSENGFGKSTEMVAKDRSASAEATGDTQTVSDSHALLRYAGAHNPLWLIRKDSGEVEEIKGHKQPIGKYGEATPYTTHTIQLNKGDSFYIFSDGYVDQFGGDKGKKLKAKNFKTLLLSMQNEPMDRQKQLIDEAFEKWKGGFEQLDDVCVIGIRI